MHKTPLMKSINVRNPSPFMHMLPSHSAMALNTLLKAGNCNTNPIHASPVLTILDYLLWSAAHVRLSKFKDSTSLAHATTTLHLMLFEYLKTIDVQCPQTLLSSL